MADDIPKVNSDDSVPSRRLADNPAMLEQEALARLGTVLGSKYQLESVIGSGGMAHVYRATNTVIGRTVAIKVLRSEYAKMPEVVERFLREAKTANLVRHPNVVDVIDVGQDAEGSPFIVQEFLEGETLYSYAYRKGGAIPLAEMTQFIGPVLSAIGEAHARGVVHRDIKPENIFLSTGPRGRRVPKILDFGISKVRGADMTQVGMMLGTPAYMAPEVAHSSKDADPRSDIWAIGVMLFELLSGRVPFDGESLAEIFMAISSKDAAKLVDVRPDVPPAVSRVIERCLKRDPSQRYPNANELAWDLAAAFEENAPGAASSWSIPPKPASSNKKGAAAVDAASANTVPAPPSAASAQAEAVPPPAPLPAAGQTPSQARLAAARPSGQHPSSSSRMPAASSVPKIPNVEARTSSSKIEKKDETTTSGQIVTVSGKPSTTRNTERRGKKEVTTRTEIRRISSNDVFAIAGILMLLVAAILVALRIAR